MSSIKSYAERLAQLELERTRIAEDMADIKKEAEGQGLDKKILTDTVRMMLLEKDKQQTKMRQLDLFDVYLAAVGIRLEDQNKNAA